MDIRNVAGWDFWINLAALAVALLAMGFAIWTYFKSKQRKLITYEFEDENTNVVSVDRDLGEDIQIYMYTRKNPDSLAASFIAYVKDHIQTGDTFIRIQDMHGNALQAHM